MDDRESYIRVVIESDLELSARLNEETLAIANRPMWHTFAQVAGLYAVAFLFAKLL